ncbi:regulatory protein RecX [Dokdonella sp.]|uniref:regulatory protein RecX n=1 Tax=Dokdonella sp. TaxID=2291710 RepID=UPI0025C41819|nr:regulatory protein RecX [Dokdonella sp.]MBX3693317.1 regulatory protein RecX [Dokdonella sp.]
MRAPKPPRPKPDAFGKALSLLARREQSRRELGDKLKRGGYAPAEVEGALDGVVERGYQDDARFAAVLARSRAASGYGPRRIAAELRSHGLDPTTVASALADVEADWLDNARRQMERRYGRKPAVESAERARRAGFLLRRGFDAATVSALTRAECGDPDDDFD